jgi:H+/Cl- antiporter ClcA
VLKRFLVSARRQRLTDAHAWGGRLVVWAGALLAGLAVVGFAVLTDHALEVFFRLRERTEWLPLLLTPVVGMAVVWLTRRFFAGAEGSGIPQVIAAAGERLDSGEVGRLVSLRLAFGKVALGAGALAGGFSAGREGPSVQIAASIMHACRHFLPRRFVMDPRNLMLAGGAAGIAAAFNTPLAGIIFAIEELSRRFEQRTNGVLITSIVWAGLVSIAILGNYTYFGRLVVGKVSVAIVPAILVAGIVCGLAGGLFSRLLISGVSPIPLLGPFKSKHPVLFAGLCGLLVAIIGVLTAGATFGSGYGYTRAMLLAPAETPWYYSSAKFLVTVVSYYSGIPGGIFAPALAVGAGIGRDLVHIVPEAVTAPAVMALSMAAFLAAVTHAPLTSFIIVMEMIDGHAMVISLMAVAMIASLVSRLISKPLYSTLAQRLTSSFPQPDKPVPPP